MGRKEEYKLQNEQFMQTLRTEADVHELPCGILYKVLEEGTRFRKKANGYGLGSGNSIPDYMQIEGFYAMVDAVKEIRRREQLTK